MENKHTLLILLGAVIITSGCMSANTEEQPSSGPSESPDEIVTSYINNFVDGNTDDTYDLISSEIKSEERTVQLEQKNTIDAANRQSGGSMSVEIINSETVSESENEAEVELEIDLYAMDRYVETVETTINLTKENGEWRITDPINPYSQEGRTINFPSEEN